MLLFSFLLCAQSSAFSVLSAHNLGADVLVVALEYKWQKLLVITVPSSGKGVHTLQELDPSGLTPLRSVDIAVPAGSIAGVEFPGFACEPSAAPLTTLQLVFVEEGGAGGLLVTVDWKSFNASAPVDLKHNGGRTTIGTGALGAFPTSGSNILFWDYHPVDNWGLVPFNLNTHVYSTATDAFLHGLPKFSRMLPGSQGGHFCVVYDNVTTLIQAPQPFAYAYFEILGNKVKEVTTVSLPSGLFAEALDSFNVQFVPGAKPPTLAWMGSGSLPVLFNPQSAQVVSTAQVKALNGTALLMMTVSAGHMFWASLDHADNSFIVARISTSPPLDPATAVHVKAPGSLRGFLSPRLTAADGAEVYYSYAGTVAILGDRR